MSTDKERRCCFYRYKNEAKGDHCRSCNARVCREHQAGSGYGNHGGLQGDFKIFQNNAWERIRG